MSEETQQVAEQTTETPVVETQAEEPKVHPAYEKVLAELPEAWHAKITPHLQEQDKYFQQQLEKYTPFKSFIEEGISADTIKGGIDLANAINTNPLEVYSSIKEYLTSQGMLEADAQAAAAQTMEAQTGEDFEDIFDGEKVPAALQKEIDALKAKTEEVAGWKNEQEFAKMQAEAEADLEAGMTALKQAHNITEAHEIAIWDLMNAALSAGREITVAQAAQQLQQMVGAFPAASTGEPAPMVVGSAGGAGVPAMNTAVPKDDKGKKAMMAQMFEEYQRNNR
jgi:hypothetical protein